MEPSLLGNAIWVLSSVLRFSSSISTFAEVLSAELGRLKTEDDLSACDVAGLLLSAWCHSNFHVFQFSSLGLVGTCGQFRLDARSSPDMVLDQLVQNTAARLLTGTEKQDLIRPCWPPRTASSQF